MLKLVIEHQKSIKTKIVQVEILTNIRTLYPKGSASGATVLEVIAKGYKETVCYVRYDKSL